MCVVWRFVATGEKKMKKSFIIEGYEMIVKKPSAHSSNAGILYVPRSWIGKKVVLILEEV
jgi:putative transposon-encoded protein